MRSEILILVSVLFATSFLLTVLAERRLLPILHQKKAGQPILVIGPSWHLSKSGTPTLGGLAFVLAVLLSLLPLLFFSHKWGGENGRLLLCCGFALLSAAIGLFDDLQKLARRQNKGLSAPQKYFLQLLISALFLFVAEVLFAPAHSILLPFSGREIALGRLYYPLALVYLTGLVNALNLTDGVDGLLSSLVGVLAVFLLISGIAAMERDAALLGALLLGAALGFLCFNLHPAKVFMGDTGSLFFGGLVAGYGILSPSPLTILLACGVFVLEALSVVLQIVWFKLSRGKRLFRMAPLHHHFEKGGWGEMRVVAYFCFVGALFAILAFFAERV